MSDKYEKARTIEKYKALKRAEWNLRQAWARIDYKYNVIEPGVDNLTAQISEGVLPAFELEDSDETS